MRQDWKHFDFDSWIEQYYLTYLFFSWTKKPDKELVESELDIFRSNRELFFQQKHLLNDDNWSGPDQYLWIMTRFNSFCKLIFSPTSERYELVQHFLEARYSKFQNLRAISKTLTNGKTREWVGYDNYGNQQIFTRQMVDNIREFLNKLHA